jgi:hypothetical protein
MFLSLGSQASSHAPLSAKQLVFLHVLWDNKISSFYIILRNKTSFSDFRALAVIVAKVQLYQLVIIDDFIFACRTGFIPEIIPEETGGHCIL